VRALFEPAESGMIAPARILLLPAAYTEPEDFLRAGFVRAARERKLPLDLVFLELKLQHLTDRTLLSRLHREIVLPARAAGCRSLWLGGISLGGFVSIAYAERHPREIEGLCLLAPYLGNHIVTREIERANGVLHWKPGELAEDDDERRIWRFIQEHRARLSPLHLGFGHDDRFAHSQRLMAAALPPESVDAVPGGHDWPTWLRLWENFLDKLLPQRGTPR
jgi:Serine aminopeptidase, S33